ncbi:uncharacterized protein LOC116001086 [Ipomoea triloba]|uniref:uncharacterized protein LOC116001086 n=1 Tax=Ipomoea triloba TaxID=35885 RepID=UPI00125D2460|nr:uncharacterized protein LOC116001086 [Ipomoea triloba]
MLNLDDDVEEFACISNETSALISKGYPIKKGDLGAFVVPCDIKDMEFNNALVDLEASINFMPSCVLKKMKLPYLSPTRLNLYLADGTIPCPKGIAEDMLVKVGEFIVPLDFVVCDMGVEDSCGLLIHGRPFLATCGAIIDVGMGEITLRINGNRVVL